MTRRPLAAFHDALFVRSLFLRPALALCAFTAGNACSADPLRVSLAWVRAEGAASCPEVSALRASLARRLGRDPVADPPQVWIETVVSRAEGPTAPWTAALYERAADGSLSGERTLEAQADSCAAIVDAVALAIAASLDGDALPVTVEPPPPPPPPPPPVTPRPATRRRVWAVSATLLGGVSLGLLPAVAPMASLRVELRRGTGFGFYFSGLYQPPASVEVGAARASLRLSLLGAGVCPWRGTTGPVSLTLCAGVMGGVMVAAGHGFSANFVEDRPFVAVDAGARARWSLGRTVHVSAEIDGVVPLVRDTLVVEGVGAVHRVSPVGLLGLVGLGMHFE